MRGGLSKPVLCLSKELHTGSYSGLAAHRPHFQKCVSEHEIQARVGLSGACTPSVALKGHCCSKRKQHWSAEPHRYAGVRVAQEAAELWYSLPLTFLKCPGTSTWHGFHKRSYARRQRGMRDVLVGQWHWAFMTAFPLTPVHTLQSPCITPLREAVSDWGRSQSRSACLTGRHTYSLHMTELSSFNMTSKTRHQCGGWGLESCQGGHSPLQLSTPPPLPHRWRSLHAMLKL